MIDSAKICMCKQFSIFSCWCLHLQIEFNDNNLSPNKKFSGEKSYIQNLDLLKLFFSEYRSTTAQQNWVFIALVNYHRGNLKISFAFSYLPFTILFHLSKTTFPTAEMRELWAEEFKGVMPFLWFCPHYYMSTHFAQLPSVSVQQHMASAWGKKKKHTHTHTHS